MIRNDAVPRGGYSSELDLRALFLSPTGRYRIQKSVTVLLLVAAAVAADGGGGGDDDDLQHLFRLRLRLLILLLNLHLPSHSC